MHHKSSEGLLAKMDELLKQLDRIMDVCGELDKNLRQSYISSTITSSENFFSSKKVSFIDSSNDAIKLQKRRSVSFLVGRYEMLSWRSETFEWHSRN